MTPKIIERVVHHGHGFSPPGRRSDEEMDALRVAMATASRDMAELELDRAAGLRAGSARRAPVRFGHDREQQQHDL
jgi:hypothetical protein